MRVVIADTLGDRFAPGAKEAARARGSTRWPGGKGKRGPCGVSRMRLVCVRVSCFFSFTCRGTADPGTRKIEMLVRGGGRERCGLGLQGVQHVLVGTGDEDCESVMG
jgi:hypothetical protein